MKKVFISFLILSCVLTSCFQQNEKESSINEKADMLGNSEKEFRTLYKNNSSWTEADKIKTKIISFNNTIQIAFDFAEINDALAKGIVNKKDTLHFTSFKIQLLCNGRPLPADKYKGGYYSDEDTSGIIYTSVIRLGTNRLDKIQIPFYVFSKYPANSKVNLQLRLWQDVFLSEEIWTKKKQGAVEINYIYRDTLQKKLIDNTYSFVATVPEIYKTNIVCDSLILQNDKDWSPLGSDNTIWNSSLPDIYFAVSDEFWNEQSSSHIEKSSWSFTEPDTISYYHYSKDAIFRIGVYDHDNLSRDDALGSWKGELSNLENRKRYLLKFGHIDKFYLKKIESGLQN